MKILYKFRNQNFQQGGGFGRQQNPSRLPVAGGMGGGMMGMGGGMGGGLPPRPQKQNAIEAAFQDKVPRAAIEEKEQELLAKDETIQILQAKIRRLEHLVHLKDIRIDELQQKVQQFQTGIPSNLPPTQIPGPNNSRGLPQQQQRMVMQNGANSFRNPNHNMAVR